MKERRKQTVFELQSCLVYRSCMNQASKERSADLREGGTFHNNFQRGMRPCWLSSVALLWSKCNTRIHLHSDSTLTTCLCRLVMMYLLI